MARIAKRNKLVGTMLTAKEKKEFNSMCKVMKIKPGPKLRELVFAFAGIKDDKRKAR